MTTRKLKRLKTAGWKDGSTREFLELTDKEAARVAPSSEARLGHPFIGVDKGDGSDVSGNIKSVLRTVLRGRRTSDR